MTEKKLPSGVGKKIVEALKKQKEIEMEMEPVKFEDAEQPAKFTKEPVAIEDATQDIFHINDSEPQNSFSAGVDLSNNNFDDDFKMPQFADDFEASRPIQQTKTSPVPSLPANVTVLKRLISQLPNGVTRQTGAQIIRQTMEALGISMNGVLHEAQQVQDSLNESVKDCMLTVQEYRNNIKTIEKQVLDYQKQASQLNDLISLFVLTDKKNF